MLAWEQLWREARKGDRWVSRTLSLGRMVRKGLKEKEEDHAESWGTILFWAEGNAKTLRKEQTCSIWGKPRVAVMECMERTEAGEEDGVRKGQSAHGFARKEFGWVLSEVGSVAGWVPWDRLPGGNAWAGCFWEGPLGIYIYSRVKEAGLAKRGV